MGSVGNYTQAAMPFVASIANTNWATRTTATDQLAMGRLITDSTAQNNAVSWPLYLDSVTWKCALIYGKDTDQGVFSIQLDDVEQGTVDAYAAAPASNNYSEVTGLAVSTAGVKTFELQMATKNASSSAYGARLNSWAWVRTGGTASSPAGTDTPGYTWEWFPWMGEKSGTSVRVQDSARLGGGQSRGDSTLNNERTVDWWRDIGTYKVAVVYTKDTDGGVLDVQWDSASQGTIDTYNASETKNNYSELTGLASASAAVTELKVIAPSKNASSTAYNLNLNSVKHDRTG